MSRNLKPQGHPNRARAEVEAMRWDEYIPDELGDLRRDNAKLQSAVCAWRLLWLFTFAVLVCLLIVDFIVS